MEHAQEARSGTPPDTEILLRSRGRPDDKVGQQEKRLQLLLQEAEELNARLREQLANSQGRPPQQARGGVPTSQRQETEPSMGAQYLPRDEAHALHRGLESRKRRRDRSPSPVLPHNGEMPYRTSSPDTLSEADSSRTSPRGWTSGQRHPEPTGHAKRTKSFSRMQAYANPRPDKGEACSHTVVHLTSHEQQVRARDAYLPMSEHQRQAPQDAIGRRLDEMLSTPFGQHIIAYEHRVGYSVPKFSLYDGSTDPFDHLMHYRQVMSLEVGNEALLCKVFPASLSGAALSWFHRLPPFSIHSFRELSEAFVNRYLCSIRTKQTVSTLQNVKMAEGESLRDFMKRFGQAVLQVEKYSIDAILQIFKANINPGTSFFQSLAKKPPTTMDELYKRADKYAMLEDDLRAVSQQVMVASRPTPTERQRPRRTPPDDSKAIDTRRANNRPPVFTMPPLTVTLEQLLPVVQELPGFRWPGPIRTDPDRRDRKRRCSYHKEHGHTTEKCYSFRFLLEKLWKEGYLNQYVQKANPSTAPEGSAEEPTRGVIRVIHSCSADARINARRQRRKIALTTAVAEREELRTPPKGEVPIDAPISFPPLDRHRVVTPHDDALVLAIDIGQYDVRRALVDPGSSADLIQATALQQMGYPTSDLANPGRILSGFNGATTRSIGDIVLPVRAGPVTLNIRFSVVEDLTPYNAILGRTWLHAMKAVPSTYHQMISYVTKAGQVNLLGNQAASRQCYHVATESQPDPTPDEKEAPDK